MTLFEELDLVLSNLVPVRGIFAGRSLKPADIIGHTLGEMVQKQGMDLKEFAVEIGVSEPEAQHLADILID